MAEGISGPIRFERSGSYLEEDQRVKHTRILHCMVAGFEVKEV